MTSLIITIALLLLPWLLFKSPKSKRKSKSKSSGVKINDWAVDHYRHQGFIGEISDFTKGQKKISLSKNQNKLFEQGQQTRDSIYEAEQSKNKNKELLLRKELARNDQWAKVVGKQDVYDNAHKMARLLADHGDYDEAFSLASSLTTLGVKPFEPEASLTYGFYFVESLALDAMSHACRRQGNLRDAIYQNMYWLRASILEVHYNKLGDKTLSAEHFVASKARITDARYALGKRNEIAKILELPKVEEREVATLIRQYVSELVDCVHASKTKKERDTNTLTIFKNFSTQVLSLIPDIPKQEMIRRTQIFDDQ